MNTNIRLCDHCEEQPIALKITATTADGILLDVLRLCAFCGAKWNRRADLEIWRPALARTARYGQLSAETRRPARRRRVMPAA